MGAEVASAVDGAQSLALVFSGRAITAPGLQQALALAPGAYELRFAFDNDTNAQRPFAWQIACSDRRELLTARSAPSQPSPASEEMSSASRKPGWQQSSADFVVPEGCSGQTIRLDLLTRSTLERQLSGTLFLDAIRIQRR